MLVLPIGSAADFEGFEGLAAMTADMMDEGTGNLSAIDVNAAFARLGAHLDTDVSADATVFTRDDAREVLAARRCRCSPTAWFARGSTRPTSIASGSSG